MGPRLVVMAASMNNILPPIENSATHWVTQGKRPIVEGTIAFIGEHNYEQPHIDDGILDIEGQRPTERIVTKCSN
jgi:hypothetical protein